MVKIGNILESLSIIHTRTLRNPTHIIVSNYVADDLVNQYNELANSDADMVYQYGERKYDIRDVGDFLGVQIAVSTTNTDGFKILEEVTPDS